MNRHPTGPKIPYTKQSTYLDPQAQAGALGGYGNCFPGGSYYIPPWAQFTGPFPYGLNSNGQPPWAQAQPYERKEEDNSGREG